LIHPTAQIEDPYHIGQWTKVWHNTIIRLGASIGENCTIGCNVYIDRNVKIGDKCKIQNYANIYEGVRIGNGVFIGPHVCFTNDKYPHAVNQNYSLQKRGDWKMYKTEVGDGASIGARSVIVCGVKIGKNAMIGAGSVVTKNIPDNCTAYGNPAKVKRKDNG